MSDALLSVVPVILAGGSGTRLWPLSRSLHPKQYLSLGVGAGPRDETLFQQAALRLASITEPGIVVQPPSIVANEEHRFTVIDQLRSAGIEPGRVLLEPFGRNTAPALELAALDGLRSAADESDPILVIAPADHAIGKPAAFTSALRQAVRTAAAGGIVVLGIRPDRPDTGYGYIRADQAPAAVESLRVASFVEKPEEPVSTLAATATYVFHRDHVRLIQAHLDSEPGADQPGRFVAWLQQREPVYGWVFAEQWFDIGDHEQLLEADNRLRVAAGLPPRAVYEPS